MQDNDSPSQGTDPGGAQSDASASERGADGMAVSSGEEEVDTGAADDTAGSEATTDEDFATLDGPGPDAGGSTTDGIAPAEVPDLLAPSPGPDAGPAGSPTAVEGPESAESAQMIGPTVAPAVVVSPASVPSPEPALPIPAPVQAPVPVIAPVQTPMPAPEPAPVPAPAPLPVPVPVPAPAPALAPESFTVGASTTWSVLEDVPLFMGANTLSSCFVCLFGAYSVLPATMQHKLQCSTSKQRLHCGVFVNSVSAFGSIHRFLCCP